MSRGDEMEIRVVFDTLNIKRIIYYEMVKMRIPDERYAGGQGKEGSSSWILCQWVYDSRTNVKDDQNAQDDYK
jgi:hypothetical protein